MELVRRPEHADRQFAAKVHCFRAGYERVKRLEFDIVGNLDADLTFEPDLRRVPPWQIRRRIPGWAWQGPRSWKAPRGDL